GISAGGIGGGASACSTSITPFGDGLPRSSATREPLARRSGGRKGARGAKIAALRPGDTIAGRYEIVRSVRSGGPSVVFQAADKKSGQKVAVKIINVQPSEEALLRRIEREIKILTSLSHPHVVGCLGAGSLPDGRPYLILEWLEGEDLADFKMRAPMTLRR